MNNPQASVRSSATQSAISSCYRPALAVMIVAVLSGCSSLTGTDRLEIPANTSEFRSRLYTGASIGPSRLSPDTRGTVFNVQSNSDSGTQLRLGYDVHNMLAVEIDTSVLGAAELREANTDVKYSSAAVSALIYGLSGVQMRSRREGLSAYARLGYGSLKKSSAVIDLEESGMLPILGLGAEYGFSNGLGVRGEITRFDGDASYIGFGAIYRFGISPSGIGSMIAQAAEPALGAAHTTVAKDGRTLTGSASTRHNPLLARNDERANRQSNASKQYYSGHPREGGVLKTVEDRWRPAMRADDRDADGVLDVADNCNDTGSHVTVDRYGCGLFDAVLDDVTFKSGSRWLSPRARGQLDHVAETLLAFPESRVQVRAHTDAEGAADMNLGLSSRRAEVVVQYLQSRGVNELQLQAAGIGEAQPLDSNGSADGRRRNRRVDLVTLPDLDAGHLLVASSVGTARVISVSDASQIQPDRDSYQQSRKNASGQWNVRDSATSLEPGLQAAKPVTTESPAKPESSAKPATQNKVQRPAIRPLPVPGVAPGLDLAGVVEGLSFPQGSAVLNADGQRALQPVVKALQGHVSVTIAVMAHTDDRGDAESNLLLSQNRAEAVVKHLTAKGIDGARLKAEGYGELLPLVQNVTEEDRARNRRIEIRVLP